MTPEDPPVGGVKYCPECRGEFVAHLDRCPDCGVALTFDSPGEPPHPEPVEVFSTLEVGLLPLVRSTLAEAGIEFEEIERDLSHGIVGEVRHETAVLVAQPDASRAEALLGDIDNPATGDELAD